MSEALFIDVKHWRSTLIAAQTYVLDANVFIEAAKIQFASVADGWLIAYALAKRCVVVTHERADPVDALFKS